MNIAIIGSGVFGIANAIACLLSILIGAIVYFLALFAKFDY